MYSILKGISYFIQQKVDCIAVYNVVDTNIHILDLILKGNTEYNVSFECTSDLLKVKFSHYGNMFNSSYDEVDLESNEAKEELIEKIVHYFDNAIVNIMLHYQKLVNDNKNKIDSLSKENKEYILHSAEKYKALLLEAQKNNIIPDNEEIKKDMEALLKPNSTCPFLELKSHQEINSETNENDLELNKEATNSIVDIVVSDKTETNQNYEYATSDNVEDVTHHIENEIEEIHSLVEMQDDKNSGLDNENTTNIHNIQNVSEYNNEEINPEIENQNDGINGETINQESSESISREVGGDNQIDNELTTIDTRDEQEGQGIENREGVEIVDNEIYTELNVNPQPTHMQVGDSVILSIVTNADTYTFELTNENAEYNITTDTLTALKEGEVTAIVKAMASDYLQTIVQWNIMIDNETQNE